MAISAPPNKTLLDDYNASGLAYVDFDVSRSFFSFLTSLVVYWAGELHLHCPA